MAEGRTTDSESRAPLSQPYGQLWLALGNHGRSSGMAVRRCSFPTTEMATCSQA